MLAFTALRVDVMRGPNTHGSASNCLSSREAVTQASSSLLKNSIASNFVFIALYLVPDYQSRQCSPAREHGGGLSATLLLRSRFPTRLLSRFAAVRRSAYLCNDWLIPDPKPQKNLEHRRSGQPHALPLAIEHSETLFRQTDVASFPRHASPPPPPPPPQAMTIQPPAATTADAA